jgi:hypothetical protein
MAGQLGSVLSEMSSSPCEKVASKALLLWSTPEGEAVLCELGRVLVPLLLPHVVEVSVSHWSDVVRSKARVAIAALQKRSIRRAQLNPLGPREIELPQFATWSAICAAAVTEDPEIDRALKMAQICRLFAGMADLKGRRLSDAAEVRSLIRSTCSVSFI